MTKLIVDDRRAERAHTPQKFKVPQGPCEDAGGSRYKGIYIHSKTSPISTYPERPLSKDEATAPKPP
jgi:hypothetical protein